MFMSVLFDPIELNGMKVPNRLVRSATNDRLADFTGDANDALIAVYEALAAGGVGLIITGHAYVSSNGKASPEMIGVHNDSMVPGLARLVQAVHKYDSKIVLQINHAGRQTSTAILGETPVAPSAVYNPLTEETPKELAADEIEALIGDYVAATRRGIAAGFDGVQIHCAHGYLGSQFISPYTNKRTDQWGGSLENRMRFPLEVYRRIRKSAGDHYPVMVKLNSEDFLTGGLTIEDSAEIAGVLSREGIDAIEISGSMAEAGPYMARKDISEEADEAYFLPNAREFRKVIDVPLILVGGVRSPGLMERLLSEGEADMMSMSRPFIREPDLVNRWKNGTRRKADCISCNGCFKYRDEQVRCILLDKDRK
jgi:2,4-dienoyl-CoA reductase-like NADH-dependent reductase (Old Yellow Enzyme family)